MPPPSAANTFCPLTPCWLRKEWIHPDNYDFVGYRTSFNTHLRILSFSSRTIVTQKLSSSKQLLQYMSLKLRAGSERLFDPHNDSSGGADNGDSKDGNVSLSSQNVACQAAATDLVTEAVRSEAEEQISAMSKFVAQVGKKDVAKFGRGMKHRKGVNSDGSDWQNNDQVFMREALLLAHWAAMKGEVPVGAVIVHSGKIIARAHNLVEAQGDPTAHAEMLCIQNASRHLGKWRLLETTIYVTLEPCPMCAGAILQARIGELVWGARNTLLGADGSWVSLFPEHKSLKENDEARCTYPLNGSEQVAANSPVHPFHPNITVRREVLAKECSEIMRNFFHTRRKLSTSATKQSSNKKFQLHKAIKLFLHVIFLKLWYKANLFLKILRLSIWMKAQ